MPISSVNRAGKIESIQSNSGQNGAMSSSKKMSQPQQDFSGLRSDPFPKDPGLAIRSDPFPKAKVVPSKAMPVEVLSKFVSYAAPSAKNSFSSAVSSLGKYVNTAV